MTSIEFIFALLIITCFTGMVLNMENEISKTQIRINETFKNKLNANNCSALINFYYAESGNELTEKLNCKIESNQVFAENQKAELVTPKVKMQGGIIFVETENHYN